MNLSVALTKLAAGAGRLGRHLLSRKLSGAAAAASALAIGLAAWGIFARSAAPACAAPLVVEVRNETARGRYDSFAYETCRGEAGAEGRYENDRYGFSVGLPGGAAAAGSPRPDRYAGGGHDPLERRLDEAVDGHLSLLRREGDGTVRVLSRAQTSLGGLPAARVVAAYGRGGAEMVSDQIIAFRREEGGGASAAVAYTIDLSTTLDNYERDRPVLEAMRQTWHLQAPR